MVTTTPTTTTTTPPPPVTCPPQAAQFSFEKGDLVLVHGKVDHLSLMNNSPISRHCFQLHLVEGGPQSQWRPTNWQQYDKHGDFPRLHEGVFSY